MPPDGELVRTGRALGSALVASNCQAEASKAVDELLAQVPDFPRRGLHLIRCFAYLDEHADMLLDRLHKAGLEFGD